MFALVEFSDKSKGVYPKKAVKIVNGNDCVVKCGRCRYGAVLVAEGDSPKELETNSTDSRVVEFSATTSSTPTENHVPTTEAPEDDTSSPSSSYNEDSEYEPDEGDDNSDGSNSEYCLESEYQTNFENNSITDASANGDMDVTNSANIAGTISCDPIKQTVEKSRGPKGDKKMHFCFYCHKKQFKIARHLEMKHKDKEEVKKFINLPKKSKERKEIIAIIRSKGNFLFNTDVNHNDGTLIVSRRPMARSTNLAENYMPCGNCKSYYSENSLRIHFAKCTGISSKKKRIVKVMGKRIMGRVHQSASDAVRRKLIPVMKEDHILSLIRYDTAIITYANNMCERYKMSDHHYDMIRARMRLLGRFLKTMREINKEITDLSSVYDPKYSDDAIRVINIEAGINESGTGYKTPSVASTLGTLLKKVGDILSIECIKNHHPEKKKNVKDFVKILNMQLSIRVNKTVIETQIKQQRHKKVELPSLNDIKKLHSYLLQKRTEAFNKLQESFSIEAWTELAETTLSSVQLFNRRRAGEVQRILIEDFRCYQKIDESTNKELFNSLTKQSQEIANKYVRFAIRGKLNRTVPVLLSQDLFQCINMILKYRRKAKVNEANPYVFGIRSGDKSSHLYLKACILMRKYSTECGAQNPDRLRGTALRKHIATNCLALNISDQEVGELANFMGHAKDIHKNIYRQPIVNTEIIRMSRLLEMAQGENNNESSDENYEESEITDDDETTGSLKETSPNVSNNRNSSISRKKRNTPPYGTVKRRRWSDSEKKVVMALFGKGDKLPSYAEIEREIQNHPCLATRTAPQIKTWIYNQFKKKNMC